MWEKIFWSDVRIRGHMSNTVYLTSFIKTPMELLDNCLGKKSTALEPKQALEKLTVSCILRPVLRYIFILNVTIKYRL